MHTKNLPVVIISHCPLSSKLNFPRSTPYIRRCLEIIESARITWGYYSDEYKSCCYETVDGVEVPKKFPPYSTLKLTSARSIQNWYTEHSDLILVSQKTPEAIKKAVQDVRRYTRLGIESSITDKEILAIFTICEAFGAIYNIQCGKSEDAIKEKVLSASTFLKLAKTGFEPATQPEKQANDSNIFFDNETCCMWLGSNKKTKIEPEDAKVFKSIVDLFSDGKRDYVRIEEVILCAYKKTVGTQQKIIHVPEYKKCKSAFSTINSKYRELLGVPDKHLMLIKSDGHRTIILLKPVVFRKVLRKATGKP